MVCSFVTPLATQNLRQATLQIARPITDVLLGVSRERSDVVAMLRDGPTHFLALTASAELPHLIATVIKEIADAGRSTFSVSDGEICDSIGFFVMCTFGSKSPSRIGACYTSNFQRLVYNVAACSVSMYADISASSNPEKNASLRRATCLIAQFTDGLKAWLPVADWLNGWSAWHALSYTLEMTNETIVQVNNNSVRKLSFLIFCDEIFRHVLQEHSASNAILCSVADLKTAFGWCACSQHFEFILRCCTEKAVKTLLPNAMLFSSLVQHSFNAPLIVESCTRPASPEPSSPRETSGSRTAYQSPPESAGRKRAATLSGVNGSAKRRRCL